MKNLPTVITDLIEAQNNANSSAYANCFSEMAVVVDEGKTYNGRKEIEHWIAAANEQYKTVMKPLNYNEKGNTKVLSAEVSGSFPGSPVVLNYHMEIIDNLIQSLKTTT
ncbi:polyketide cyclase [Marivirga lumbricoides]|uniref:Polyketide cyclase n=1 Tax=Marivirga lumbricoides TaxID=1046115 RepID=A0ABQ1LG03_9BACT|nr:polyketide cyclase [Marivirga lumbricoides]